MQDDLILPDLWQSFKELIDSNRTYTITTHVNPDGDAVGSELALYHYLTKLGKEVRVINSSPVSEAYIYLENISNICEVYSGECDDWIRNSDVICILDMSTPERMGIVTDLVMDADSVRVCIDHHPGNTNYADLNLVNESAAATAEIITEMYQVFRSEITQDTAEALYTGVITDTESFSNSHTNARTHRTAALLISKGADPAYIYRQIYKRYSWQRTELFTHFLSTLQRECNDRLAWSAIDALTVSETGAVREEMDGFVDFPLSIGGVELSVLFIEVPGRGTKISIRSHETIDANAIAAVFGGGGHRHAAGIRLFNTGLHEALEMVLPMAREASGCAGLS